MYHVYVGKYISILNLGILAFLNFSKQFKLSISGINTRWDFNAFSLDRLTGGQNLATLCTYLFRDLGLLHYFKLDALIIWKFFASVERHYHSTNPYHNGVHATDVTQAMSCFIQEALFKDHLKPVEKMAAIIGTWPIKIFVFDKASSSWAWALILKIISFQLLLAMILTIQV